MEGNVSESFWREKSALIIREVLKRTRGEGPAAIKKALFDAYPFGERRYHPYKVWCSEIARQTGRSRKAPTKPDREKLAEWEAIYGKRQA
jgi:hypothetical protein